MARVLVTGSTDGIGRQTAVDLVRSGNEVVIHARNDQRAQQAADAVPGAAGVVVGDLSSLAQTRALAEAAGTLALTTPSSTTPALEAPTNARSPKTGWIASFRSTCWLPTC